MLNTSFPRLTIRGRALLPVIQGGMGVGISAHRLAGSVAREGAIGTIASVELRRLHPDILARTHKCRDQELLARSNLEALDREVTAARALAGKDGFIAVNVMRAVKQYRRLVARACESGANAIIAGAGLPLDLPEIVDGHPDVALIPILSEPRGVRAVVKRWLRHGRVPDAIVIEHPGKAGGHLGATRLDSVDDPAFDFAAVFDGVRDVLRKLGLDPHAVPLIAAGGINSFDEVRRVFELGGSGVQVGTPFAVTAEGDADPRFKQVLAEARAEDIVTFMSSAGLPARAVLTPWLEKYLKREARLRFGANPRDGDCPRNLECLSHCGLKDGNPEAGQFCIETHLAAAQRGDIKRGLFFRGRKPLPFGDQIRPVRDLLEYLLSPAASPA